MHRRSPTAGPPALCVLLQHCSERATGIPLLLLHQLGGSVETWQEFAIELLSQFDIYAFDQRCAGATEKTLTSFSLWNFAEDAVRFTNAVEVGGRFAVMGLASVAVTALHVAIRYRERVCALVLCDGTSAIVPRSSSYVFNRGAMIRQEGMRVVADVTVRTACRGMPNPETRPDWCNYRYGSAFDAPVAYAMQVEALAGLHLDDDQFDKVSASTLSLAGQHDCTWPPNTGAASAARASGARFKVVELAAHLPRMQNPAEVPHNERISEQQSALMDYLKH